MGAYESREGCECPGAEPQLAAGVVPSAATLSHSAVLGEHSYEIPEDTASVVSCHCEEVLGADPLRGGNPEHFVTAGLRTRFDCGGVSRHGTPPLNIAVVLDVSGSMDGSFPHRGSDIYEVSAKGATKLDAAKLAVAGADGQGGIVDALGSADNFALLAFNQEVHVVQDLTPAQRLCREPDSMRDRLDGFVANLSACGTANVHAALAAGGRVLAPAGAPSPEARPQDPDAGPPPDWAPPPSLQEPRVHSAEDHPLQAGRASDAAGVSPPRQRGDSFYCRGLAATGPPENRILVFTDDERLALGHGAEAEEALRVTADLAARGVHTTFIGMQLRFSDNFAHRARAIRGCDCFGVRSVEELQRRVVGELRYIAWAVAYDAEVRIAPALPGVPSPLLIDAHADCGDSGEGGLLLRATSVFARPEAPQGGTRGRVAAAQLPAAAAGGVSRRVELRCTDRFGALLTFQCDLVRREAGAPPPAGAPACGRKIVALQRLVSLLRACAHDERAGCRPHVTAQTGIVALPHGAVTGDAPIVLSPASPRVALHSFSARSAQSSQDSPPGPHQRSQPEEFRLLDECGNPRRPSGDGRSGAADAAAAPAPGVPARPLREHQDPTPVEATKLGNLSEHYRRLLVSVADGYLAREAEGLRDRGLAEWRRVLLALAGYAAPGEVAAACRDWLTTARLCSGVGVDDVADALGGPGGRFCGMILPEHRGVICTQFASRMLAAATELARDVVAEHPQWCAATPRVVGTAVAAVRARFARADDWEQRWGDLVLHALTQVLNERVFTTALSVYRSPSCGALAAAGSLGADRLLRQTTRELAERDPDLGDGTAAADEVRSYLERWVVPVLLQTGGDCVWCASHGRPVPTGERPAPFPEVSGCPQQ